MKNEKTGKTFVEYNPIVDGSGLTFNEQMNNEALKDLFSKPVPEDPTTIVNDNVNHPSHYTQGVIECIDAIEASMTPEQFRGAMKANIIKYLWRYGHKNGLEDLKKARFYLERMIASFEKGIGEEHV